MKSLISIILILASINYIYSTCEIEADFENSPEYRDGEDCAKREFSEEESENNAFRCCLIHYTLETANNEEDSYNCIALNQTEFGDIDYYIDYVENQYERLFLDLTIKEIDCKSNYIKSFFILSFILIFL